MPTGSGITIQLKGGKEVADDLRRLADDLPKNVIRKALRESAQRLRKVVLAFAPRRNDVLVDNISVKTTTRRGISAARVTVNTDGKRDSDTNAFYWRFLEKGWHDRKGVPHRREFVKPAFDTEAEDAAQFVIDSLGRAIEKAGR